MLNIKDQHEPKIITQFPVQELWVGQRLVSTIRIADLIAEDVNNLLNSTEVRFVMAEIGKELCWIPNNARFDFWRESISSHLIRSMDGSSVNNFIIAGIYRASRWQSYNGDIIVLIEKYDN